MSNYVAAIDLGTTKVVTIVGEKTPVGMKIVGYSEAPSAGVMRGEVVNIQKVLDSLVPTIRKVEEQIEGFHMTEAYVGIAGQNIRCEASSIKRNRSNPSALISQNEIDAMLKEVYDSRVSNGEKVLHVIPQSYIVDEHMGIVEGDVVGMDGKEIQGNYRLFIGRVNSAAHSEQVVKRAGIKLNQLVLEPIASAKALLTNDEKELGVAMVDIGGGTTDLLIYEDNIIRHTAVIPFGGNAITEDIRQICGVSLKHAEALKKLHGTCLTEFAPEDKTIVIKGSNGEVSKEVPFKLLASAIEARVSEIIATVMYEIEKSSFKDKLKSGIVITGGSANLTHLQNIFKQLTGYKIRIAGPDPNMVTPNSMEDIYKPSASTAVGLILCGEELGSAINMAPSEAPSTLFENTEVEEVPKEKATGTDSPKKKVKKPKASTLIDSLFGLKDANDNDA